MVEAQADQRRQGCRVAPRIRGGVDRALSYAEQAVSGAIPVCRLVQLAAQRFLDDYEAAQRRGSQWTFDTAKAERAMMFASFLPNVKGPLAGQRIALMDWQCLVFANLFGFVDRTTKARRFRQGVIFVPRGNGKGLSLDAQIATPTGFVSMGDVKIDDLVFDRDGSPVRVSYVSPVHIGLPCYEVEFSTGERIICDEQHLWLTQSYAEKDNATYRANSDHRVVGVGNSSRGVWRAPIETAKGIAEIAATLECRGGKNHRVRVARPLQLADAELLVDPYVLGYWLGDGLSATGRIAVGGEDEEQFALQMVAGGEQIRRTAYQSNVGKTAIYAFGEPGRGRRPGSLAGRLRLLGVLGNKHVPADYLRGSTTQRWALLQGLMDSDGFASAQGQCEFSAMRDELAGDLLELAASLGLRPTLSSKTARLNGRDVGTVYIVRFHAYADQSVFRLTRKQCRLPERKRYGYQSNRMIVAVRPVMSVPTRCIQVESESRTYLVGRSLVPTHNTTFAAPIALYLTFMDGEGGAEGYAAAVTRDQARILFDAAQQMTKRSADFRREEGVEVTAKAIYQERTASRMVPVSSDAKALDGLNVQVAVCDEIASHKTSEVYDVLLTAMGKRLQPLLLAISTATANTTGVGKQLWDYSVRVLEGRQEDDRIFALLYTVDDGDDPWEETTWIKANPSWGQAVQPDAVRAIMRQARNNPAQEAVAKTRHLNIWVGADDALFLTRAWRQCADPKLRIEDFEGQECHIALDLASKTDLAAISVTFSKFDDDGIKLYYTTFARCYLNDAAVLEARNPSYPGWAAEGFLTVTPGNETDFGVIEADLLDLCGRFRVLSVGFDPWSATQLAQRLTAEGVPMVEFRASTQNFSEPTKELDAAMQAGRITHDGNPVLEWCVGNVVGHYDARSNVYPRKARPENKIDAAITTIMTIARCMAAAADSPYSDGRGLLVL